VQAAGAATIQALVAKPTDAATNHRKARCRDQAALIFFRPESRSMAKLQFRTFPASSVLQGVVKELWVLEDDGGLAAGLPKPFVEVVVSLSGVHWWRAQRTSREHRFVDGWVTPVQDGPRYARSTGKRRLIGARLEPWAAQAAFGPLVTGNGTPPQRLSSLIGNEAAKLQRRLKTAASDAARAALFCAWLEARLALHGQTPPTDIDAPAAASAQGLADIEGVSARTFRRRFSRDAGIPPKRWLMLRRIDSVLRDPALWAPDESLAAIALDHGYADRSHMTREIKRFAGVSPTRLRARPRHGPPHLVPGD
jgi:AraC-like DNA-binding protein